MITIQLNGEEKILSHPLTLKELLQETKIQEQAIAVAINSEIIPRSAFETVRVRHEDRIEVIRPVGGG